MQFRYLIVFLLLSISVASCYQGSEVSIHNKSGVDKNIRVIYPAAFKMPINKNSQSNDSLAGYDHHLTEHAFSSRDYYRYPSSTPVLSLDTLNRTYTFIVKDKHQVFIERNWPVSVPTYGQIFIIDNRDTIELKKRGKDFKKRGRSWTYTIREVIN